jgi:RNA polymerase sigma-70 factor (ECF subfamily)
MKRRGEQADIVADSVEVGTQGGRTNCELRSGLASILPEMRSFARFLVREPTQADDLVQDAVVRALSAADQFEPGSNLRAWVFTILRNLFREKLRRSRTEQRIISEARHNPDSIEPEARGRADIVDLQKALWQLSPDLREALILVGAHELDYEEAALICGVPIGTMKARVSRARAKLAQIAVSPA